MHRMIGTMEADNLDFATHNYTPRRPREGDYCQVSLYLDRDPESGQFALYRRRNPALALDPLSGGHREEIAQGLLGLRFDYYDGYDWYESWGEVDRRSQAQNSRRERYNLAGCRKLCGSRSGSIRIQRQSSRSRRASPRPAYQRTRPLSHRRLSSRPWPG